MSNIAQRLTATAKQMPNAVAVAEPRGYDRQGKRQYRTITFAELDRDSDHLAAALRQFGLVPGSRAALLVPAGVDFVALVFALFKAGLVAVLIDPGMGPRNMVGCLAEAQPCGFIAIPLAQAVRTLLRRRFAAARCNVTVGRRWFWGGATLRQLRASEPVGLPPLSVGPDDAAAIIFTSGSTGAPKGVLYSHGNFSAQVDQIRDFYGIQPGEVDVAAFPLFALFNCAMGVTAVIPDMNPSRPAKVDPAKIVEAVTDWKATQAFGSPAVWNRVGPYCLERGIRLPSLRRVLSAGAPVPSHVLERMTACIAPDGDMHTPYGATEALPVASAAASEILGETAAQTARGAGVCVGRKFSGVQWKVIRIVDGPIASLDNVEPLPPGEVGELIVSGLQVTRCYVTRPEANALGKIAGRATDPPGAVWHRMGDAGYFDDRGRFWFCGRLAHRVLSADGPMFTIPCEAIFNQHPDVFRSALVGVGEGGRQCPVIIVEPQPGRMPRDEAAQGRLVEELRQLGRANRLTCGIDRFLVHPAFPVDIRHNAKIFREKLAVWAARRLAK